MDLSTGFDRGLDRFALLVHYMTASVKDVGAWSIRTILENNESLDRLVIGRRPFLTCHFDDRSCDRYFFGGACPLPFTLRFWLRKRQRREQCAADEDGNWFLHVMPPVDIDGFTSWLVSLYKGIPERVLHEI
jgi:hypothetical protein